MNYKTFEDIPVWQQSRRFIAVIYKLTENNFKRDYGLIDQIKRSSVSILLNIAEGFELKSNKEFARHINIAKGSAGEVRSILYVALDNNYIDNIIFEKLSSEIISISKKLSKFNKYLLNNQTK